MKKLKKLVLSYLPEFLFVSALGVLLHFTYDWSGNNPIVGLFSATNESTWEHLKLLFFPMLLLTLWQSFRSPTVSSDNVSEKGELNLPTRTWGIISGMAFIVITFYTLSGVFGTLPGAINIAIYFISVAFSFFVENSLKKRIGKSNPNISRAILILFTIAFFVLTFFTPSINLFTPPDVNAIIPLWE